MKNCITSILFSIVFLFSFAQDYSSKSDTELDKLKSEAIKKEDYRLAGLINDEIEKRESEVSNVERISQAESELEEAVANEDYKLASQLKKEIDLRERLEKEVENENYAEAADIKRQLNGEKTVEKKASNETKEESEQVVSDVNFDEENYNSTVNVKGHTPPRPGKAAVYMLRVSGMGFAVPFKYFVDHEFIGESKGVSYVRAEVDPGQYVFWSSAENESFITVDAEAGRTYFIYVDVKMGVWGARATLSAVLPSQDSRIKRGLEVVNGHDPSTLSDSKRASIVGKLERKGFVQDKMNAYETKWKSAKNFDDLPRDAFIPESKLK